MLTYFLWATLFAAPSWAQNSTQFTKGQKWQIILSGVPDTSKTPLPPTDAPVWDIDLFDADAATIQSLKSSGKTVICYFSAGTVEDWRTDAKDFPAADVGKVLPEWPNEKWIRIGSSAVRAIMAKRIKLASDKGCDAIDPDNVDGYQNDNGLNLQSSDAINYVQWMATEASKYGMQTGLKNALDIVDALTSTVSFAVNEQCAQLNECSRYTSFLAAGKPVFHIEYPTTLNSAAANSNLCKSGTDGMSTLLKNLALDGPTVYCDGSFVDTPTKGGSSPGRPTTRPVPTRTSATPRPSSTRPQTSTRTSSTATPRPSTTPAPPPTTVRTSSVLRPTSSAPSTGCKSKHWEQCGGQDWKGCTVCESGFTCKPVSPPWYYQCL